MDAQLLTLSKIFTERLFRIPDYQRGYAWTEKQLRDFWNDIQQLQPGRHHYTGVLTLEQVPQTTSAGWEDDSWIVEAKSYQPFFVVDGQQRLTTAIILIQVILEATDPDAKLNYTSRDDITRKFIFDSKDDGISRSYVFGYEKDNPSYEFLKTRIFMERSSSELNQVTVYTSNLQDAKNFFADRIKGFSHLDLEVLYGRVTQNLLFNIFTITEDVDVCVAFETMNNRGKPLSYLELLKNRLIYLSLKFPEPDFERQRLRRAINDCWKSIYHNLGRNTRRPLDDDHFLSTHYRLYFGTRAIYDLSVEEPILYRRLSKPDYATDLLERRFVTKNVAADAPAKSRIALKDIYRYVSSLQDAIETWYKIHNPFDSDLRTEEKIWLDKLARLGTEQYLVLVLSYLQQVTNLSERVAFLKCLERHIFLRILFGRYALRVPSPHPTTSPIELAIELRSGSIDGEKVRRAIGEATARYFREKGLISSVIDRFSAEGYYQWDGIRYFLYEYNLSLQERSKTDRPKIFWSEFTEAETDFISVEHIYPQQARHGYWTSRFGGLTQNQREALRNSLERV